MDFELTVVAGVDRDKFIMESFIGSDDIFAIVKSGSFYVECDGETFTVKKNEGMLFRKDVLYNRRVIEPVRMFLFRYKSNGHLFDTDHIIFKDTNRISSTIEFLEQLESKKFENDFNGQRHLFEDILFQYTAENKNHLDGKDEFIRRTINIIKADYCTKKSIEEYAAESGLSYIQFFRRFKAATGFSPSDYITSLRLNKAKNLLINTTLRINEISSLCGFENEYYFSNFFKKHTDLSPSAFRSSL